MLLHFLLSRRPITLIDVALRAAIINLLSRGDGRPTSSHLSYPYLSFSSSLSSFSLSLRLVEVSL